MCCLGSLEMQDSKNRHMRTIAQLCRAISSYMHVSTIGKNLLKYLPTCLYNMVNFDPLTAETCWRVWGTPANFHGFRVLAPLLHGTLVVGVSQTLRRSTEGATYIRQGGHHVGHWPLVLYIVLVTSIKHAEPSPSEVCTCSYYQARPVRSDDISARTPFIARFAQFHRPGLHSPFPRSIYNVCCSSHLVMRAIYRSTSIGLIRRLLVEHEVTITIAELQRLTHFEEI